MHFNLKGNRLNQLITTVKSGREDLKHKSPTNTRKV